MIDDKPAFPHELAAAIDAGTLDQYLELRDQAEIARDIKAMSGYKPPVAVELRDYFAAAALTGYRAALCVNAGAYPSETKLWGPAQAAREAYRDADAMLAERERKR